MINKYVEKVKMYNQSFPNYPPLSYFGGWIYGVWIIGNDYKGSSYYGSYPPSYLERVLCMFPGKDRDKLLHLFSGSLKKEAAGLTLNSESIIRIDLQGTPDLIADANSLPIKDNTISLILADPPYSVEDACHYQASMINRNKVIKECHRILKPKGSLVWLDQVLPMYSSNNWKLYGTIGVVRSTNHRFRVSSLFEKKTTTKNKGLIF